jgi:hypothetical protein
MTVIFFGEELKTVNQKNHFNVVENQLRDGLFQIEAKTGIILYWPTNGMGYWRLLLRTSARNARIY